MRERTSAQAELFKQGLRAINVIYGQQHVKVWCLTRVPRHVDVDYFGRGWCTFELTIASVLKVSFNLLDMGKLQVAPSAVTDWIGQVQQVCKAGRRAPLTPGAFGAVLATKHFTNGKTDHELVVGLYADFVREALGGATALSFNGLEWGDAEAMQLAEVLPLCTSLKSLSLGSNVNISDAGVRALAERLPSGLEELDLSENKFTAAGAAALVARVPASLRALNTEENRFRCPVANARTRAAVEQQVRFFQGEAAAVKAEVKAARRAALAAARSGPSHVVLDGQVCARRLRCTGRGIVGLGTSIRTWHRTGSPDKPSPYIALPVYLLTCCRQRGRHWRWLDPYRGEWLLSTDEPLCEGAPHYERRLRSGVTRHLFLFNVPATGKCAWYLGPTPGTPTASVASYAVPKGTLPTQVRQWEVNDGTSFLDDPGFAFVEMAAGR